MRYRLPCLLLMMVLPVLAAGVPLDLPGGLVVDPDSSMDLTYQVIAEYDEKEQVLAGWSGKQLQYFVNVEKLPPGWLDSEKYFAAYVRDLRDSGADVEIARHGDYTTGNGLSGSFLELRMKSAGKAVVQVTHFMADGRVSFVGIATRVDDAATDRMMKDTVALFRTASLAPNQSRQAATQSNETPYFGTWQMRAIDPDGQAVLTKVILKDDLSFERERRVGGRASFRGVGVWSVSGKVIEWTLLRSTPPISGEEKKTTDEIVSLENERLILRSKQDGKEQTLVREQN